MSTSSERRINPWSVWALIAIMVGAVPVTYAWLKRLEDESGVGRPPQLRPVSRPLATVNDRGEDVKLFTSDGKLSLVGYCYFGDEAEAKRVCDRLEAMGEPFRDEPRVQLVAVSMAPDLDTPERVMRFREQHGYLGDRWVFVLGERQAMRDYMNKQFRYPGHEKPDEFRETETDLYARELRITLVEGKAAKRGTAFIRGVYWEGIAEGEVRNDSVSEASVRYLLEEAGVEGSPKPENKQDT
jgi:cytochrome oxidase Cu insertion factor (SCO1/SenC/PrrC family)